MVCCNAMFIYIYIYICLFVYSCTYSIYVCICICYSYTYYMTSWYHVTPSPPTKSLGFEAFDSSKLLILKGGNSHARIIL